MTTRRGAKKLQVIDESTSIIDSLANAKEKIITDPTQPWHGSDILFWVAVQKKGGLFSMQKHSDRYLLVLKPQDQAKVYILLITLSGKDFTVKYHWDMKVLRAVDSGDVDVDVTLSFDHADYVWVLPNTEERDECIWVLASLSKKVCNSDTYAGSSAHFTQLGYVAISHGITTRFPLLEKYVVSQHDLKQFSMHSGGSGTSGINEEEEVEAELLLEELHWNVDTASPDEFRLQMTSQADGLRKEIISFLLQWEEEDEQDSGKDKEHRPRGSGARHSSVITPAPEVDSNMRRITMQVIAALGEVGSQLFSVDEWLSEQIKKLVEIEKQLVVIKTESTQLETSWTKLSELKNIITIIVDNLTISPSHESILMRPHVAIDVMLKDPDFRDNDNQLGELHDAVKQLRNALSYDPVASTAGTKTEITAAMWRELGHVRAISAQQHKIMEMADSFTEQLTDTFTENSPAALFDLVLKHDALRDENNKRSIVVKQVQLHSLLANSLILCSPSAAFRLQNDVLDPEIWYSRHILTGNQLLVAQENYHEVVEHFIPLIVDFLYISPSSSSLIFSSYSHSTSNKLYSALFKSLFAVLKMEYVLKPAHPCNLASVPKASLNENTRADLPVNLRLINKKGGGGTSGVTAFPPWIGFEMLLQIVAPLIKAEMDGCVTLFQTLLQGKDEDGVYRTLKPIMDIMFSELVRRTTKFVKIGSGETTAGNSDVCEIVGMLAVLEFFVTPEKYFQAGPEPQSDDDDGGSGNGGGMTAEASAVDDILEKYACPLFLCGILDDMRVILQSRLENFLVEQISWLDSMKKVAISGKKTGVLPPFEKLPSLVDQIQEMTGTMVSICVS